MARRNPILGAVGKLGQFLYGLANGFGVGGSGFLRRRLPQAELDYSAEVREPFRTAPAFICLTFLARNATKPDPVVSRERGKGKGGRIDGHPLIKLLTRPNPYYSYTDQLKFTILELSTGNAYWVKVRNYFGTPIQLIPVPSRCMQPISVDPAELITHYIYTGAGVMRTYPREDVVHFRDGIDPDDPRLGLSEFGYLARELYADNALSTMKAALCRNLGLPGLVFSPSDGSEQVLERDIEVIEKQLIDKTTGEHRGEPLGLQGSWKIDKISWSLRDMDIGSWQDGSAERVCAATGLNAMAVNLPSKSKTFANYGEAIRSAWNEGILPRLECLAETINHQLLPDLGDDARERFGFDTSGVPSLAESEDAILERNLKALAGGGIMRSEFRAAVGLPATADDEVYYLPRGAVVVSGDNLVVVSIPDLDQSGEPGADADDEGVEDVEKTAEATPPDVAESEAETPK